MRFKKQEKEWRSNVVKNSSQDSFSYIKALSSRVMKETGGVTGKTEDFQQAKLYF